MKRYCPLWLITTIVSIFLCGSFTAYLLRSTEKLDYSLKTNMGDSSVLSPIQIDTVVGTSNTNYVTSNIGLGKDLSIHNNYTDLYFYGSQIPNNNRSRNIQVNDCMTFDFNIPKEGGTFPLTAFGSSIPFSLNCYFDNSDGYDTNFPYVDVPTTTDMKLYASQLYDGGQSYSYSHCFYVGTSLPILLKDNYYFTVNNLEISSESGYVYTDIDYTIRSGIFVIKNKKLEKLSDYTLTNRDDAEILDLFALEERDCLGLLIREKNKIRLQIFNINTNTIVNDTILYAYDRSKIKSSNYNEYIHATYNASSSTLAIYEEQNIPSVDDKKIDALYDLIDKTDDDYTCRKYYEQIEQLVKTSKLFRCYTIDSSNTPILQTTLDSALQNKSKDNQFADSISSDYCDFIYKDDILYVIFAPSNSINLHAPYIAAIKNGQFLYEGRLISDIEKDYSNYRGAREYYKNYHDDDFNQFLRYYSMVNLSLKN